MLNEKQVNRYTSMKAIMNYLGAEEAVVVMKRL